MPSYPPRQEPVRKVMQLSQKEMELEIAIRKNFTGGKFLKAVQKYRHAQLATLKAKLHVLREQEFQKKQPAFKLEKLEAQLIEWTNKSDETILDEFKAFLQKK